MNRYEHRSRWTGRALIVLSALWVAIMCRSSTPGSGMESKGDSVSSYSHFSLTSCSGNLSGAMRMIAYIRWTGKYPYYFLFAQRGCNPAKRGADRDQQKKVRHKAQTPSNWTLFLRAGAWGWVLGS